MRLRLLALCLSIAILLPCGPAGYSLAQNTLRPVPTSWAGPVPAACPVTVPVKNPLEQRVFQVADLVVPLSLAAKTEASDKSKAAPAMEDRLIKLITGTIAPNTWSSHGGPGTIDYFPLTMTLVVNQTPDVQEQIADLLGSLRRLQDRQVVLEVRLLSVPPTPLERIGIDFEIHLKKGEGQLTPVEIGTGEEQASLVRKERAFDMDKLGLSFLDDKQVFKLLEEVQGDMRCKILQAPKITVANGQMGIVKTGNSHFFVTGVSVTKNGEQTTFVPKNEPKDLGFCLTVQPAITLDGKGVQLYVKVDQADLASPVVPLMPVTVPVTSVVGPGKEEPRGKPVPFTQYLQQPTFSTWTLEKLVAIPDGKTAVFGGIKKMVEGRVETRPPVLSKVPYINRLFKNVGYGREEQMLLVLVTPRIVTSEGEERIASFPKTKEMQRGYQAVQHLCPNSRFANLVANCLKSQDLPAQSGAVKEPMVFASPPRPQDISLADAISKGQESESSVMEAKEVVQAHFTAPPEKANKVFQERWEKVLVELLQAYDVACAQGRKAEAEKLARAALLLDPTCFSERAKR